jgi:choice-of-anchor C domain-containing protein
MWGIVIAALCCSAAQSPASLIVNGDFEDGPTVGTFLNIAGEASTITGWIVTGEGIDLVGKGYYVPSKGARSLDLDGSARSRATPPYAQGGIAQTFPTTPGQRYAVTFDLAGNPARPPMQKPMRVLAAGESMDFVFDITGKSAVNMGWLPKTFTFTAKETSTTLEFRSLTVSPLTGFGAAIDNVVVTVAGPEDSVEVRETEDEIQVLLGAEILFDTGQYALKPEATGALQKVGELLKGYADLPISIEGHTDSVGRPQANQTLSENRAGSVKTWLVGNAGIPDARITTKGYGQTAPAASNDTPEGRQKNRRVEIKLQKK